MLIAACSFTSGDYTQQRDAPDVVDDMAAPREDAMAITDGPVDSTMVVSDAPPIDGPIVAQCTTAGLPCTGATVAITCNGGCWVKCTQSTAVANQAAAATACTTWGGKLAPIRTSADANCVAQTLFPSQAHWIGLEQAGSASSVTASWSWNGDGIGLSYTNWDTGQPNDVNGNENDHAEQCAFMNTSGDWHDTSCNDGGLYRFSCRRN